MACAIMAFLVLPKLHNWFLKRVLDGTPYVLQLQLQRSPSITPIARAFFDLGLERTYVLLLALVAWNCELALGRKIALLWAVGFYVTNFLKDLLKLPRFGNLKHWRNKSDVVDNVGNRRPHHVNDYIVNVERRKGERFGLPCSKSFTAACLPLYLALATQGQNTPVLALILVLLWCSAVTSARIYFGTHTPADVVAGVCLGISFALLWLQYGDIVDAWALQSAVRIGVYGIACALCVLSYPHPPFYSPDLIELSMVIGNSIGWLVGGMLLLLLSSLAGTPVASISPASSTWEAVMRSAVGLTLLAQVRENIEPTVGRIMISKPWKIFSPRIDANTEAILKHSHARHLLLGLYGDYLPPEDMRKPGRGEEIVEPAEIPIESKSQAQLPSPPDEPENVHCREAWQRKASTAVPAYATTFFLIGLTASFAAPLLMHLVGI